MSEPEYWKKAIELEAAGKLQEAERVIFDALRPRGEPWPAQQAELYRLRCKRLAAEGKVEEAKAAATRGIELMWINASGATSGGEGTALSNEAKDFEREVEGFLSNAKRA